jgi:uncharacterized membrane protein YgcG
MIRSFNILASLSILSMLGGCPDDTVIIDPPAPTAPMLASGVYALRMESVERWDCRAARPGEVFGEGLELNLRVRGGQATADLQGLPMTGVAEPGFVYLDYSEAYPEPVVMDEGEEPTPDDDEDADHDESYGDEDREDEDEDTRGGAKCEVEEDGEDSMPDYDGDEDVAQPRFGISLDLAAIDPHNADGILVVEVEGCSAEVNVSAAWTGRYRGDRPVTSTTGGGSTGSGGGSTTGGGSTGSGGGATEPYPCDGDEEDCG